MFSFSNFFRSSIRHVISPCIENLTSYSWNGKSEGTAIAVPPRNLDFMDEATPYILHKQLTFIEKRIDWWTKDHRCVSMVGTTLPTGFYYWISLSCSLFRLLYNDFPVRFFSHYLVPSINPLPFFLIFRFSNFCCIHIYNFPVGLSRSWLLRPIYTNGNNYVMKPKQQVMRSRYSILLVSSLYIAHSFKQHATCLYRSMVLSRNWLCCVPL